MHCDGVLLRLDSSLLIWFSWGDSLAVVQAKLINEYTL
jgi:hypothetical protein